MRFIITDLIDCSMWEYEGIEYVNGSAMVKVTCIATGSDSKVFQGQRLIIPVEIVFTNPRFDVEKV